MYSVLVPSSALAPGSIAGAGAAASLYRHYCIEFSASSVQILAGVHLDNSVFLLPKIIQNKLLCRIRMVVSEPVRETRKGLAVEKNSEP